MVFLKHKGETMKHRIVALLALATILTACPPPPATKGTLTVTISGAPAGSSPAVTVSGPGSYSKVVNATATIADLEPGVYTIAAAPVTSGNLEYAATVTGSPATVKAGATASGGVAYAKSATLVSSLTDSGAGSLRDTISAATAGDTIKFASGTTGTLALASELAITKSLKLEGTGVTLSGGNANRVLSIGAGANVTVQGLTLTGGKSVAAASSIRTQAASAGQGGVIYNEGTLTLINTEVSGGEAAQGGGVFNATGATLSIGDGVAIKNNKTVGTAVNTGQGGGVFNATDATLNISGGSVESNTASDLGGGIMNVGGILTMTAGSVQSNTTSFSGAGIGLISDAQGKAASFILSGGIIQNNSSTTDPKAPNSFGGGGVAIFGSSFKMTGGTIKGNKSMFGGGVLVNNIQDVPASTYEFSGGLIEGNAALGEGSGGGIATGSTFTMTAGTVSSNTSERNGSGIYQFAGTSTMSNGIVQNNTATSEGGGITTNAAFTFSGGEVKGNSGSVRGGGVRVFSKGTFTMTGGNIQGNTSPQGAGVFFSGPAAPNPGGIVNLQGGTIQGNTASSDGGGIAGGGTLNFSSGTIQNNTAGLIGGGVRIYSTAVFTMTGGSILTNTATEGAGVFTAAPNNDTGSTFNLQGGTISGNTTTAGNGGGVSNGATMTMTNGTITGNTAQSGSGGGVFNRATGTLNKTGGTVSSNAPNDISP
jgi:hypothetical protein